jgi:hypothetical protein
MYWSDMQPQTAYQTTAPVPAVQDAVISCKQAACQVTNRGKSRLFAVYKDGVALARCSVHRHEAFKRNKTRIGFYRDSSTNTAADRLR